MGKKKTKICPRCKIREKFFEKLNKRYRGYCKKCSIKYRQGYYQKNKEKIKEHNKIWKRNHKKEIRKQAKKYYHKNPDRVRKQAVRDFTRELLKKGKFKRIICLFCGSKKNLEFHHKDYNKPKEIMVLCKKCHQEEHNRVSNTS